MNSLPDKEKTAGTVHNALMVTPSARIAWKQNFGKFSHANDEMVTKGFRRYEVTLRDGTHVVVYNMHMDASDDEDEATQNDVRDKEARMAQWAQLKADVLQQLGLLPVVIVGDMNSLYGRDNVKAEFIEAINDTGRGMVSDVWVELQQANVYPADRAKSAEAGEMLDDSGITLLDILEVYSYITSPAATAAETPSALLEERVEAPLFLLRSYEQQLANWYLLGGFDVDYNGWGW